MGSLYSKLEEMSYGFYRYSFCLVGSKSRMLRGGNGQVSGRNFHRTMSDLGRVIRLAFFAFS